MSRAVCTQLRSGTAGFPEQKREFISARTRRLGQIGDTLPGLALTPRLSRDHGYMTKANNAGIKRNRLPAGVKPVERNISLSPAAEARLTEARMASGKLSLSLYLELLISQLEAERGSLPVLSPTLDGSEVPSRAAA